MTEREAYENGLMYTGMAWASYDTERAEYYKKKVAEIRKNYNVRVVKIKQMNGWYAYYGDKAFRLVQHDSIETLQARIDTHADRVASIESDYAAALAEEDDRVAKLQARIEEIKKISK